MAAAPSAEQAALPWSRFTGYAKPELEADQQAWRQAVSLPDFYRKPEDSQALARQGTETKPWPMSWPEMRMT
jgi:hypothetical protein